MYAQAIEAILAQQCTPADVRGIEGGASPKALSSAIGEAGFHELMAPESAGGAGASWSDFFEVVLLFGAYAVPLPLAQTLAARALVKDADQLAPGLITFAPSLARGVDGSLHAPNVPAAQVASHVLGLDGDRLLLLSTSECQRLPSGIHGSLVESLGWRAGEGEPIAGTLDGDRFQAIGALLHAGLLAGAMKRAFDLTMVYANERVQFGKSIGKFQAIQHQLSVMAEHVAAARMAAQAAFASAGPPGGLPAVAACAVAKSHTSEAAQLVASIAHAVHGAIGVTEEYDLQLYTRRLHEWRAAHGSEAYWNRRIGRLVLAGGARTSVDFARSLFDKATA